MRVEDGFQLSPFTEGHPYTTDPALPSLLKRLLPQRSNYATTTYEPILQ